MEFEKKATIAKILKYPSNFWRSLEIPMINSTVESNIRWTKHCVLSVLVLANADDYDGPNSTNINFTTKDTELYVPVVILSTKDN